jgi:hypothetical protein
MEAKATAITNAKVAEERRIEEKLEKIREYNRAHPIVQPTPIVVYNSEATTPTVDDDPIRYNAAYYVLTTLFPRKNKKK